MSWFSKNGSGPEDEEPTMPTVALVIFWVVFLATIAICYAYGWF